MRGYEESSVQLIGRNCDEVGGEEVAVGEEESSGVGLFHQRSERGELGSTCLRLCGCEFE